jgi:hypothetical protein
MTHDFRHTRVPSQSRNTTLAWQCATPRQEGAVHEDRLASGPAHANEARTAQRDARFVARAAALAGRATDGAGIGRALFAQFAEPAARTARCAASRVEAKLRIAAVVQVHARLPERRTSVRRVVRKRALELVSLQVAVSFGSSWTIICPRRARRRKRADLHEGTTVGEAHLQVAGSALTERRFVLRAARSGALREHAAEPSGALLM